MNRVFVICLLLQAVCGERNISISIGAPSESPADVTYVEGKAPEELKAGPAKNATKQKETIVQAAFIRDSSREIPRDDEIENEEFERFIQKHHNRPTIETVFVSSSPSPLSAQNSEEYNEESSAPSSQVELFKRPAEYRTFERSVAHPAVPPSIPYPSDYQQTNTFVNYPTQESSINLAGDVSYTGSGGFNVQSDGGQYSTFADGQFLPAGSYQDLYIGGGGQQHYQLTPQIPGVVPPPAPHPRTINVPQQIVKTKTYEIRRPAIQKHYYDIEERVIIRPAGSIVVELNRPVAKIPTGETVVPFGGPHGGFTGSGFQQSNGGLGYSTFGFPTSSVAIGGSRGGFSEAGFQRGLAQGGFSGTGVQQSLGGVSYSTTFAPPTSSVLIGRSEGGLNGAGFQQSAGGAISSTTASSFNLPQGGVRQSSQGSIGVLQSGGSQGGFAFTNIPQSQGGVIYSSTPAPYTPGGTSTSSVSIGSSQGGFSGAGFQQSQGGVISSTTAAPFIPPATPTPVVSIGGSRGGFSAAGFQSQGSIGIQQGSYGGVISSTTAAPFIPPATPTPAIAIGGSQGGFTTAGFAQSQGSIGIQQGGSYGGFAGTGIQQSQGGVISAVPFIPPATPTPAVAIGGSQGGFSTAGFGQSQGSIGTQQGGSYGGFAGTGIQQSQGGVIYSTVAPPYLPPATPTPPIDIPGLAYPGLPATPAGSVFNKQQGNNDDSVVVQASSNVQNRGTFSSTTTTERSFSNTVSQDAAAFARGSASGSGQVVSQTITPYMIAVGEPNFQYPPYVEINSNGSPLGHLHQQPYARVQDASQSYPRMRYQGQLLIGEVQNDDGFIQKQQNSQQSGYDGQSQHVFDNPEIPPNEEQQLSFAYQQPGEIHANTQYLGSTQQPVQVSQTSSNANQQPAQVYQHHFVRTTSQPIQVTQTYSNAQQHQQQYQDKSEQPARVREYQQPIYATQNHQQHAAQVKQLEQPSQAAQSQQQYAVQETQHPIQVAQYQNSAEQPTRVYQSHATYASQNPDLVAQIRQQHAAQIAQQPNQRAQIRNSIAEDTQQQQVVSSTQRPEPLSTGQRLYQQRALPLKYTQHHTINVTPSQHTIFFNNQPQKLENSGRSQNLETPPEVEANFEDAKVESSTTAADISSTTRRLTEAESKPQQQTYASVLSNSKPGILYASPDPAVPRRNKGHSHHTIRFNSEGSSLFSPSGRQLHFVYSQPSRAAYSQQTPSNAVEGLQSRTSITQQRQSQLPAPASEPQQSRSQSYDESQPIVVRSEAISSTTPAPISTKSHNQQRGQQKYRNEQTRGALTLRSGRTYGDHRVIASTPAPSDASAASESVQTRRIVVSHPFQTVQQVVEQEPITNIHQVTVNEPAQVSHDGLQQVQQNATTGHSAAYKVAATFDHPALALSYRNGGGSH